MSSPLDHHIMLTHLAAHAPELLPYYGSLVNVAKAAEETRDFLRTVGAEEGNPVFGIYQRLEQALAALGKEDNK